MKAPWLWFAVGGWALRAVTLGCRAKPESPDERAKAKPDEPPLAAESTPVTIRDTPVSGSLLGRDFRPDKFELGNRNLELEQHAGGALVARVTLFFFLDPGQTLAGRTWEVSPAESTAGSRPHVHAHVVNEGATPPTTVAFMDGYTLRLSFSEARDGLLTGRLYLALPDDSRSVVSGTFLVEAPANLTAPLSDSDKPYVTGRIGFARGGAGTFRVGYCSAAEYRGSGLGITIQPDWDDVEAQDSTTGFEFRRQQVTRYRHVRLTPGTYLFYAKWNETSLSGRWLTIDNASAITLDLTLNPQESGTLDVHVASDAGNEPVYLLPLDEQSRVPPGIDDAQTHQLTRSLGLKANVVANRARFETLGPGPYRVFYGRQSQDTVIKRGETAAAKFP